MAELSDSPLFNQIKDEELEHIRSVGETINQPEDEPLFQKGDPGDRFYTILDGLIKITIPDPLGERNKTLALLKSGDVLGEMALLTDQNRSGKATPGRDTKLFSIDEEVFSELFQDYPQLGINLSKILSRRLWDTDSEVQFVTFKTIPGRLASQLIRLGEEFGVNEADVTRIDIKLTHQELADIVGTNRETVTRHLNKFKEKNLISFDNNEILIQNWERLKGWM